VVLLAASSGKKEIPVAFAVRTAEKSTKSTMAHPAEPDRLVANRVPLIIRYLR